MVLPHLLVSSSPAVLVTRCELPLDGSLCLLQTGFVCWLAGVGEITAADLEGVAHAPALKD